MGAPVTVLPDDEANRALVRHVHPPGWVSPAPAPRYDLVVLGGGTAGLVSAMGAAGLGARVALVERQLLGGDCLAFGCVPSKAVLAAAHAAAHVRRADALGVRVSGVEVDARAALARMRRERAALAPHDSAERLREAGVDVFLGEGRFAGPDAVEVDGATLRFRRAVIATGGRPVVPPVPGLRELPALTSDTLFELEDAPRALVVVGGGPIGCELGQAFRRLGSEVTLVELGDRLLPRDDPEASDLVREALEADGVRVLLGHEVTRVEAVPGGAAVTVAPRQGGAPGVIEASHVLVAVGRRARVDGLGLDAAGVAVRDGRLVVDARLRTTSRRVYAAGDVAGRWQLTHAADAMARLVLRNALFLGRSRADDLVVPWATYTDPEVAHVGVTREEAERDGLQAFTVRFDAVDRARLEGQAAGFARIYVDGKGRLRGAIAVHARAGDLIGEAALAISAGLGAGDLSSAIHPYPTVAEVWRKLGDAWNRTRLTPRAQRLLGCWLRLARR